MNSDAGLSGAGRMFPGSSMQWVTPGDRGLVEVPVLAPHLEFRPVDHETGLLVSETYCAALYGQRYLDLLPLLDGTRTRREVAAALSDRHSLVEVQTALVSLATKGHVVSGAFSMNRARAAFWSAHGASPCWAEQRLEASQVSLSGDDGRLAERLAACGVQVGDGDPTLAARVTDDYLAADHEEANRRHRSSGMPWLLVKPDGVWPLFGPVFQPGEGGGVLGVSGASARRQPRGGELSAGRGWRRGGGAAARVGRAFCGRNPRAGGNRDRQVDCSGAIGFAA